jgi:hypothetical protein
MKITIEATVQELANLSREMQGQPVTHKANPQIDMAAIRDSTRKFIDFLESNHDTLQGGQVQSNN